MHVGSPVVRGEDEVLCYDQGSTSTYGIPISFLENWKH